MYTLANIDIWTKLVEYGILGIVCFCLAYIVYHFVIKAQRDEIKELKEENRTLREENNNLMLAQITDLKDVVERSNVYLEASIDIDHQVLAHLDMLVTEDGED